MSLGRNPNQPSRLQPNVSAPLQAHQAIMQEGWGNVQSVRDQAGLYPRAFLIVATSSGLSLLTSTSPAGRVDDETAEADGTAELVF